MRDELLSEEAGQDNEILRLKQEVDVLTSERNNLRLQLVKHELEWTKAYYTRQVADLLKTLQNIALRDDHHE